MSFNVQNSVLFCRMVALFLVLLVGISAAQAVQQDAKQLAGDDAAETQSAPLPKVVKNGIGMEFRLIPAGEFMMGNGKSADKLFPRSPDRIAAQAKRTGRSVDEMAKLFVRRFQDEYPRHRVRISHPFYMQTTEVTQKQWKDVMATEPWKAYRFGWKEGPEFPATAVSWEDADKFCKELSRRDGLEYRLPTEAEWEFACRGGQQTMFSFGDDPSELDKFAWYGASADARFKNAHKKVGDKVANDFGLFDMHGNEREWCSDWYQEDYYEVSPSTDPTGPKYSGGSGRVSRGGSWAQSAEDCRSAARDRYAATHIHQGFRLVRTIAVTQPDNTTNKRKRHDPR